MPQPQDNTLGAPTEGLGQTVTFTGGSQGRVPQMQAGQRQAIRNNSSGGGAQLTARALQVPEAKPDPTFGILMKLGGEVLKPHLEAERTAAYVEGMQKAASGQAITEIVNEQPWYSQLFGSTSLVDGARAYTASAKAASMAADMEAKMPELRKMDGQEFSKYAAAQITQANTGDATTDMMIAQQVSATLPAVMKGQAKAHLRYTQQLFEDSIVSSADAKLALVQTTAAASRTPGATKDTDDALGTFIQSGMDIFARPGEIDKDLHEKLLTQSFTKAIGNGNFDAYRLIKDSGKLAEMNPDYGFHIERAYQQASNRAKLTVPDQLLQKVADFRSMARRPGVTDEMILQAGADIDREYTQITGDPGSFIGNAATVAELQQLREFQDAEQARLRRARETAVTKEEKKLAEIAAIDATAARVVAGDGKSPFLMLGMTSKEQQEVFDHLRLTASPEVRSRVLVDQVGVAIDKTEKDSTEAAIATAKKAGDPGLLYRVYTERYLPLVRAAGDLGESVAQQYAGQYGKDMAVYHSLAKGQAVPGDMQGVIYNEVVNPSPKPLPTSKRNSEIVAELKTGWFMSMFTTPIKDPEGYAAVIEPRMKSYLSTKDAISDAKLQMPTLSLVGGYHWQRSTQTTDIKQWVAANKQAGGVAHDNLDKAMEIAVSKYSKEAGIEAGVKVGQTVDTPTGEPQLYVMGAGSDGAAKLKIFKAGDLHSLWKSGEGRLDMTDFTFNKPADFSAGSQEGWQGGQPVTPQGMPSIYASQEEWAAYRKRKAQTK